MSEYRMKCLLDDLEREKQRAQRAEAECERLRADNEFLRKRRGQLVIERDQARGDLPEVAPSPDSEPAFLDGDFTLSLRELQHGLNCLSVDNAMDRPDFQLAWDIYEAAKQCATPSPEAKPELLTGRGDQRPKRDGWAPGFYANTCQSCGRSFVGDKRAWTCADCAYADDEPQAPQQAHGDALAVVERIEGQLCGPSGRLNEPVAHIFKSDLDCIRQALTASGVPERRLDDYEVRAALAEKEWITECARYETSKFGEWMCDWYSASAEADRRYENAIAAAPTDGRES